MTETAEPPFDSVAVAATPPFWRSAIGTIGARAIDLPSRYGFHLLVAARLGLVDAGAFYIIFSMLTLAAGAGRLGVDRAITREVARALARGDNASARRTIGRGLAMIAAFATLTALTLILARPLLAKLLFDRPGLELPLLYAALATIPLCLSAGAAGALAGFHRVSASQMIYSWLWPGLFCLVALAVPMTLASAMLILLAATSIAALLSFLLLGRIMLQNRAQDGAAAASPPLLGLGWSLFTTEIVQLLMSALPALVLGLVADEAAVGAFAMAWRLALVLNLLVVAVAATVSPRFAHQAVQNDLAALRRTAIQALGLVLGLGLLPMLILFVAAPHLLALFGGGFVAGTTAMRILLLGQLILMMSAGTPEMLGMTGHERDMQRVNNVAILIFVPVLVLLAWVMRAEGAAIATVLVSLITAAGSTLFCRRHFGFVPLVSLLRHAVDRHGRRQTARQ